MRVEIENLGFGYPTSDPVLANLDLTISEGSFHAIVGTNGCGKTTLLRLIAGLETPTDGSVSILGERCHVNETAFVFQTPRLLPWWNIGRNVGIGLEFAEAPEGTYERIRDFYTAHVGLGGLMSRLPGTLSRGQQSRAGLGRAFAHDADVLLMDEPFAHLDAISRRKIQEEIEAFWRASPRTVVLVTHDIEEAVMLADRVSVMRAGPGPLIETIEVDAGRPRSQKGTEDPGVRSAIRRTWDALEGT